MDKLTSLNPSTNQPLGEIQTSTEQEIKEKVEKARNALKNWSDLGVGGRVMTLRGLAKKIEEKKEELATQISQEMGMPITQSRSEVYDSLRYLNWYLDNAEKYVTPEITHEDDREIHQVFYEPLGVIAAIAPWNYPLSNFVWTSGQALLAGNTIVFKHSEECPLFGKMFEEIIKDSGLTEGVFNEVYGDGTVGDILVHQNIDAIIFTGSSNTGKYLYKVAAEKFIKVLLEMGGSAPGIVFADANLDEFLETIYSCRFANAGQMCDALKRLMAHESKFDEIVEKLKTYLESKKVGDAMDEQTDIGPLVAKRQLEVLEEQVKDAVEKGAKIITGGKRAPGEGNFYEPTLITDVTPEMRIWNEEVFGPVLPVIAFKDEEQAIRQANHTTYGLGAYIFSSDKEKALKVAKEIDTGMVSINGANYVNPFNPFGGNKSSGMGREHGKFGFSEVTKIKIISSPK